MDDIQLRGMAQAGDYGHFCRFALRFIVELGGMEALDRFEALVRPTIEDGERPPCLEAMKAKALELVAHDLSSVRQNPDFI